MTEFFTPPVNGDSPRKSWPFPASVTHTGRPTPEDTPGVEGQDLCAPSRRKEGDASAPGPATPARDAQGHHVPVLFLPRPVNAVSLR
ncbi:MAG: hypothetical protein JWP79_2689 [Polaromonas sp.]|nr:hypothetical protein [Polaromonas sp.]